MIPYQRKKNKIKFVGTSSKVQKTDEKKNFNGRNNEVVDHVFKTFIACFTVNMLEVLILN